MGAVFQLECLDVLLDNEYREWLEKYQEQLRYDHGHSGYTGTFAEANGLIVHRDMPAFESVEDAEEWLVDACEKWGPVEIVFAKVPSGTTAVAGAWCSE